MKRTMAYVYVPILGGGSQVIKMVLLFSVSTSMFLGAGNVVFAGEDNNTTNHELLVVYIHPFTLELIKKLTAEEQRTL